MKRYLIALMCLLGATTTMAQQNNTPYQKFNITPTWKWVPISARRIRSDSLALR